MASGSCAEVHCWCDHVMFRVDDVNLHMAWSIISSLALQAAVVSQGAACSGVL